MPFQCTSDQFVQIVRSFEGEPNRTLSSKDEMRFGRHGSLSIDLKKCRWFDHENSEGGDAFAFVKNRTGGSDHEIFLWLEENGHKEKSNGNANCEAAVDIANDPFKGFKFRKPHKAENHFLIVKTWSYVDENGEELFQVCRMENGEIGEDGKPVKSYYQRHKTAEGFINSIKDIRQVPYRLPELIEAISQNKIAFIVEGEKCADAVVSIDGAATCNAMGSGKWPDELTQHFKGADIVILPDNDEPGAKHADLVAAKLRAVAKGVRIVELPGLPIKDDVADWIRAGGTLNELYALIKTSSREHCSSSSGWPEPAPLPDGLLPVDNFDLDFLPKTIAPWVMDIADRMQCPADFVAIPAIVAIGAVIGRKISIRPQRKTDWHEVPNLWGCICGRPGVLKSPAMKEALNPLRRLEIAARDENEMEKKKHAQRMEFYDLQKEDAKKKVRQSLANGRGDASALSIDKPEVPKAKRYIVEDVSY